MENNNLPPELRGGVDSRHPESSHGQRHERSPLDTLTENARTGSETSNTDFILIGTPRASEDETVTEKNASSHNADTEYEQAPFQGANNMNYVDSVYMNTVNTDHGAAANDYAYSDHRKAERNVYASTAGGRARPAGVSKKFFIVWLVLAMIVTSAVTTFGMIFYYNHFSDGSDHATNYTLSKESNSLSYDSIVHKVNSSVVSIVTESVSTDSWAQNYVKKGAGSGVIIQKNGYILTCNHVIQNASKIRVNMSNDRSYPAKLIASSPDDDLAVLKISASGLNAATYGDSSKLEVGDNVIAIGNPLGQLSNTASTGIISALNRQLTIENRKLNLLQTDASINPGNSGGALFNGSGNLIGIVVAKSAGSDVEGLGFAIPINHAAEVAKKLIKNGDIKSKSDTSGQGALIGVTIQDLDRDQAQSEGFDDGGVFIISVTSPYAQKAGLQSRDRIHSLDGKTIKDSAALRKALSKHKAGDKVDVVVVRGNKKISAKVTLISASQTTQ